MSRPSYQQYLRVGRSTRKWLWRSDNIRLALGSSGTPRGTLTSITWLLGFASSIRLSPFPQPFGTSWKMWSVPVFRSQKKAVTANRTANQALPKCCANNCCNLSKKFGQCTVIDAHWFHWSSSCNLRLPRHGNKHSPYYTHATRLSHSPNTVKSDRFFLFTRIFN